MARRKKETTRRRQSDRVPASASLELQGKGTLCIIGGHEDKDGDREILEAVVARAHHGRIVVATVASGVPEELWETYSKVFDQLGASDVARLDVPERGGAYGNDSLKLLASAQGVFFTGGDQVRITSNIGGTPVCDAIRDVFGRGGVIAGTSAGASAMSETMLISGEDQQSVRIRQSLHMAPGLALLPGVIIDQHFAERGRMGRLVGAVAQNPRLLGVGIDENTAIIAQGDSFEVMGDGAVYVVDAIGESYTNISEADPEDIMAVFDLRLHILSPGSAFDLKTRRPSRPPNGNGKPANGSRRGNGAAKSKAGGKNGSTRGHKD
jgi:cyanophycinase